MRMGMKSKLVSFFVLVVILPLLAGAIWTFVGVKKQMVESVHIQNNLIASQLSNKVDQLIKQKSDLANTLANMPQVIKMDPVELKPTLKAINQKNPDIDVVGVVNLEGMQIVRGDDKPLVDVKDRSYFKNTVAGAENVVSEVLLSKTTNKPSVMVAAPIKENGKIKGVIHLTLNLNDLADIVNNTKVSANGYSYIVDSQGKVVAHLNQEYVLEQKDMTSLAPVQEGLSGKTGVINYSDESTTWLSSYTQTPFLKWVVVTQQPFSEATASANSIVRITLIVLVFGAVIALLVGLFLSGRIVRPVLALKDNVLDIAGGNLARTVNVESRDEIGELAQSINKMRENLRDLIRQLVHSEEELYESSGLLRNQAQQTSAGATEAAATVGEIAATVDEVSRNLQEITLASGEAASAAQKGSGGVNKLTSQMDAIITSSKEASRVIDSLSITLNRVNQIVELITSIADQTNLLALNAAIEAARAGDSGRGFAVVAEEVRKLAEQSAAAAKDINQIIRQVQVESDNAVSAMAAGTEQVREGSVVVEEVGLSFKVIIDSVSGLAEQIQNVASAAEQVSTGVQNVTATTEEQTSAMEEIAGATEKLSQMSVELKDVTGKFRI